LHAKTAGTTVYDDTPTFTAAGVQGVTLTTPFVYDGDSLFIYIENTPVTTSPTLGPFSASLAGTNDLTYATCGGGLATLGSMWLTHLTFQTPAPAAGPSPAGAVLRMVGFSASQQILQMQNIGPASGNFSAYHLYTDGASYALPDLLLHDGGAAVLDNVTAGENLFFGGAGIFAGPSAGEGGDGTCAAKRANQSTTTTTAATTTTIDSNINNKRQQHQTRLTHTNQPTTQPINEQTNISTLRHANNMHSVLVQKQ
jgi:hypothetical protein